MLRELIEYIKWLRDGKPVITYPGFHCGVCGRWEGEEFSIPRYKSNGKWWDTWGLCKQCIQESTGVNHEIQSQISKKK